MASLDDFDDFDEFDVIDESNPPLRQNKHEDRDEIKSSTSQKENKEDGEAD